MAKRIKRRSKRDIGDFLPAAPEVIKVIAMQGNTDDEIAFMFGLDPKIIKAWRKQYPDFDKAIEEGRTVADMQVLEALHKKATGYTRTYDVAKFAGKGDDRQLHTVTLSETVEPETNAIKYWLSNRDPERWSDRRHLQLTGKHGAPDVGIRNETKAELMSSILALIQPKPDGV